MSVYTNSYLEKWINYNNLPIVIQVLKIDLDSNSAAQNTVRDPIDLSHDLESVEHLPVQERVVIHFQIARLRVQCKRSIWIQQTQMSALQFLYMIVLN